MEGKRADDIVRADAVQPALIQLQADHALFMRISLTTRTPALSDPIASSQGSPPDIFIFLSFFLCFDFSNFRDRSLFLVGARDLQSCRGDVERIIPLCYQLLHHLQLAL